MGKQMAFLCPFAANFLARKLRDTLLPSASFLSFSVLEGKSLTPYLPNFPPPRANSWRLRSRLASEGQDEPRQGQHRPPEGQSVTPLSSLGPHLRRWGPADLPGIPFATGVRKEALPIQVGLNAFTCSHSAEAPFFPLVVGQAYQVMFELARSSRSYSELSGRTEVIVGDIVMALVEMGINVESLIPYAKRPNKISLPTPTPSNKPAVSRILQAGEKRPLPSYVPDNFPAFPDPHTYIRTPTHRQPITEYEIIREKAATQKRDIERALTKYTAKTGAIHSLFFDDAGLFPLIACKPCPNPYLAALLFKDQVYEEEETENVNQSSSPPQYNKEDSENQKESNTDNDIMDNPYLRPVKNPRRRRK
ncbi:transcription initiation factor TFIID subunit 8 [Caerostris darwini]|uniref:Transcription initiation factor TFIID subunit 8 n=1 Tax=Caerostris darwini TaxID=1538125 RepID=A0AAV4W561_9ARAC|nr:transcription initiation factor TFIID subunit 8 [Caerostris darwini]